MVLCLERNVESCIFKEIEQIVVDNAHVFFIVQKLKKNLYDKNMCAHLVEFTEKYFKIPPENLLFYLPNLLHICSNRAIHLSGNLANAFTF